MQIVSNVRKDISIKEKIMTNAEYIGKTSIYVQAFVFDMHFITCLGKLKKGRS